MLPSSRIAAAPSTRACHNCSHAKAKCVPGTEPSNGKCVRCFRLKKECNIPPRTARKKRASNTATNVAQLEQRIESLVTLLSGDRGIAVKSDNLVPPESQGHSVSEPSSQPQAAVNPPTFPSASKHRALEPVLPQLCSALTLPHDLCSDFTSTSKAQQSEYLLSTFRGQLQPHFPFIIIPPTLTSEELRRNKPWLHRAVLIVACYEHRSDQMEMNTQYILDISRAILVNGDKSLDMLESLIVYNAWSYYHWPAIPSNQSSGLFHLAHSLIFDLGLTKPFGDCDGQMEMLVGDTIKGVPENSKKELRRTSDERRALLSCYYTGSVAALCVREGQGLQHSAYLEFCCQALVEADEHEPDILLVSLVRLQSLIEPLSRNLSKEINGEFKAPIWMLLNSVHVEIQNYWNSLPSAIQQHELMIMAYHCAEMIIYEPSLQKSLFPRTLLGTGHQQRLDMLYSSLNASQKTLEHVMARPLSAYYVTSMIEWTFIRYSLKTLMTLSLLEAKGWDVVEVRQRVDLLHYFDHIMFSLEKVGAVMDMNQEQCSRDSFPTGAARAMRSLRGWYEAMITPTSGQNTSQEQPLPTEMQEWLSLDQFDYFDDAYWLQFTGNTSLMRPL